MIFALGCANSIARHRRRSKSNFAHGTSQSVLSTEISLNPSNIYELHRGEKHAGCELPGTTFSYQQELRGDLGGVEIG